VEPTTVCVDPSGSGIWEVTLPDPDDRVACETLADAQQLAYSVAARSRPCELIVRDAYHRLLRHEYLEERVN
jgi:hypothetical protein